MGKSYSYSIVVEQGGALLINDQEIPLAAEVASRGEDPLGWALDQVRESYSGYYAQNQNSELNLSVRDRRPGGLVRRAKFTHPDSGIDLDTFMGTPRRRRDESPAAPPSDGTSGTSASESPTDPGEPSSSVAAADAGDTPPMSEEGPQAWPEEPPVETTRAERRRKEREAARGAAGARGGAPDSSGKVIARPNPSAVATLPAPPSPSVEASAQGEKTYDDQMREERGWRKLPKEKSTRPQVGSAENEGRSKKLGLLAEAQKQKTLQIAGIVVLVILVIVGFRLFNGATEYEAVCVDQRTMTRTATGVACENAADTNHRWWFSTDAESLPSPGDTIDTQAGTFDEPSNDRDTINWHRESEEPTG